MSVATRNFPLTRLRRLRKHSFSRDMVRETSLNTTDFIQPLFLVEGKNIKEPIEQMPGIYRLSLDVLLDEAKEVYDLGIPAIALFPAISQEKKSLKAEESYNPSGLIPTAIMEIKSLLPELGVMADVALDPYTLHGHDGVIDETGYVLNDQTVDILIKQALCQAEAGVDIIAPSDMMDGRVLAIRQALEEHGYTDKLIMSYSAKYASSLYGPFRDAVGSKSSLGKSDKNGYQMDPANATEALHETNCDIAEGADIFMVKPATFYLDVIKAIKDKFQVPVSAYQVSGEYSMINHAIQSGLLPDDAIMESIVSIKRAGADVVISYFSKHIARMLTK